MMGCGIGDKNKQADELADIILKMVAENQAKAIYDTYGCKELKEQITPQQWQDVIAAGNKLGAVKSYERSSFELKTSTSNALTGEYIYDVKWEKGDGTFTLKTIREGEKWMVLGVNFKSETLLKMLSETQPSAEEVTRLSGQADELAARILAMMAVNKADEIYDTYGCQELKEQVTRQKWEGVIATGSKLGAVVSSKRADSSLKTVEGILTGAYVYDIKWANGEGVFTMKTRQVGDKWMLLGLNFSTDNVKKP
jgi:hypothetical protein